MTWNRVQRWCGWAALVAGVAWAIKFVILMALAGRPGSLQSLTGFLLPTLGSVLGVIGAFGTSMPLTRGLGTIPRVLVAVIVGLVALFAVSAASNALLSWSVIEESPNVVIRTESSAAAAGILWLLVGGWLLLAGRRSDAKELERGATVG